jgi:hypothetical protein
MIWQSFLLAKTGRCENLALLLQKSPDLSGYFVVNGCITENFSVPDPVA